jgi:type IV fimbrial biogenesis protein FimT
MKTFSKFQAKTRGFTMIELMITIALMALLLLMGIPSFQTFLANRTLRNVADSIHNGLLTARANAIKSNAPTVFVLSAGQWQVFQLQRGNDGAWSSVDTTAGGHNGGAIDMYKWGTDHPEINVAVSPAAVAVTFDSLGRVRANYAGIAGATAALVGWIDVTRTTTMEGVYPLRVEVNPTVLAQNNTNRGVRLCAPHLPTTDPKACAVRTAP